MNLENLKRALELIKTIPDEKFNMYKYRIHCDYGTAECGSVGCIIGHCTVLDKENFENNYLKNDKHNNSFIFCFFKWSIDFFDLHYNPIIDDNIEESRIWDYLFSDSWSDKDILNTVDHAIYRIEKVLNGYKPKKLKKEINKEFKKEYNV